MINHRDTDHQPASSSVRATGRTRSRIDRRSSGRLAIALGVVGAVAFGTQAIADDEEALPQPPPGETILSEGEPPAPTAGEGDSLIATSSTTYDPTILTKFLPGRGFTALQGSGGTDDLVSGNSQCLSPNAASGGGDTALYSGVELPDGARIKRVRFYGEDDDAVEDVLVRLYRQYTDISFGIGIDPARGSEQVTSFSTSGTSAGNAVVVASPDNLDEVAGSVSSGAVGAGIQHRFHFVHVGLQNSAGSNHALCGVEIEYQVPVSPDQGDVFHPIEPMRVFDARIGSYPGSGLLAPNGSKVIDVTDGYDLDGNAIPALADAVPANATAITYNVGVAGTTGKNFVAVTAGDAGSYSTAALNYAVGESLSNSATVTVAADQTIKVWGGDDVGSAFVIIDVTGYYAPPVPSNMAN